MTLRKVPRIPSNPSSPGSSQQSPGAADSDAGSPARADTVPKPWNPQEQKEILKPVSAVEEAATRSPTRADAVPPTTPKAVTPMTPKPVRTVEERRSSLTPKSGNAVLPSK